MICRKTVPFSNGPTLLFGSSFIDIQKLLLSGYAAKELAEILGVKNLSFPAAWTLIGAKDQLTSLTYQKGQGRLILLLSGNAYIISISARKAIHEEAVIFRLSSGSSEAVWIPESFASGFLFNASNTIALIAATAPREQGKIKMFDPSDTKYHIDLYALMGTRVRPPISQTIEI
jgi:dTDP-4-dehydrorhamnose 3,5-epimerase-like enzyme